MEAFSVMEPKPALYVLKSSFNTAEGKRIRSFDVNNAYPKIVIDCANCNNNNCTGCPPAQTVPVVKNTRKALYDKIIKGRQFGKHISPPPRRMRMHTRVNKYQFSSDDESNSDHSSSDSVYNVDDFYTLKSTKKHNTDTHDSSNDDTLWRHTSHN